MATISIIWLQQRFNKFNYEFFGNELKMPTFQLTNNRCQLGQYSARNNHIKISNYYDREEIGFETTLIHEMIHAWEWLKFRKLSHGVNFKNKAYNIFCLSNGKYNISRTSTTDHSKLTAEGQAKKERLENKPLDNIIAVFQYCNQDKYSTSSPKVFISKLSKSCYNTVFNNGTSYQYKDVKLLGFIYHSRNKQLDKMLRQCRTRLHGKDILWADFYNNYKEDAMRLTNEHILSYSITRRN